MIPWWNIKLLVFDPSDSFQSNNGVMVMMVMIIVMMIVMILVMIVLIIVVVIVMIIVAVAIPSLVIWSL